MPTLRSLGLTKTGVARWLKSQPQDRVFDVNHGTTCPLHEYLTEDRGLPFVDVQFAGILVDGDYLRIEGTWLDEFQRQMVDYRSGKVYLDTRDVLKVFNSVTR